MLTPSKHMLPVTTIEPGDINVMLYHGYRRSWQPERNSCARGMPPTFHSEIVHKATVFSATGTKRAKKHLFLTFPLPYLNKTKGMHQRAPNYLPYLFFSSKSVWFIICNYGLGHSASAWLYGLLLRSYNNNNHPCKWMPS